jgi:RNA polymerase sigma-70 factor, ECF subfamily
MKVVVAEEARATSPTDAFATFYDQMFPDVYQYLFRAVLGNRSLAEDLTQETFVSVVAAMRDGRALVQSLPWLLGIARHKLIDHYRHAECEQRRLAVVWGTEAGLADQLLVELDREDPARVIELLRGLSPAHRLVLVLRYLDDLSVKEVARSLGRSVHATESLLVRARQELARSHQESER